MVDMTLIPNIDPVDVALPTTEKGNTMSSAKPRKKTMTSVYLKYFETAPDGKSRRCKFCGQSYSLATATGIFFTCFDQSLLFPCLPNGFHVKPHIHPNYIQGESLV